MQFDLQTLMILFAGVGMLLTLLTVLFKRHEAMWMTFLQHFCGFWFIFSGFVKAVDPIGTSFKNTEYFDNFYSTFEPTMFGFLAPIFPWFNSLGNGLSIAIITLEIVLGVMLIFGFKRKLTAWIFFLLVLFFTFLTGFTYLTGYVPSDANFFEFGKWGKFVESQMRVTDCGCFGDFIKLKPYVSFWKDVFLMLPATLFLIFSGKMHQLWSSKARLAVFLIATLGTFVFCLSNTYWQEPVADFRPFHEGADVRTEKILQEEAMNNVEIIGWVFKNDSLGKVVPVHEPKYSVAAKNFPKSEGWKVEDQIKTEPAIIEVSGYEIFNPTTQETKQVSATSMSELWRSYSDTVWQVRNELGRRIPKESNKISDFSLSDPVKGNDPVPEILEYAGTSMWIIGYHFEGTDTEKEFTVIDSTYIITDSIKVSKDSMTYIDSLVVSERQEVRSYFEVDKHYADIYNNKINKLVKQAEELNYMTFGLATVQDGERVIDFKAQTNAEYPYFIGDDKLLKTMLRSNPGIIIMKDGVIMKKYHWKHIPSSLPTF